MEEGQVVKVTRDTDGILTRKILTKGWTDWIDYWSVDFDFESKRENYPCAESRHGGVGRNVVWRLCL